jgi:DNA-nicking Smr family endonuclease
MPSFPGEPSETVFLPIEDSLDLHAFHPGDMSSLIPEYLHLCREKGILQVRLIHGKGKGVLRQRVHAILSRLEWVREFCLADRIGGDWGATIVILRPPGR